MAIFTDIFEINGAVRYPLPPTVFDRFGTGLDVYVRFMRILRSGVGTNIKTRILAGIQGTAIAVGQQDGDVALVLTELGLRAPRAAFPADFLEGVDAALARCGGGTQGVSPAVRDLVTHWHDIGEMMPSMVAFVCAPQHTATLVYA